MGGRKSLVSPGSKGKKKGQKLKNRSVSRAWSWLVIVLVVLVTALWFKELKAMIEFSLPVSQNEEKVEHGVFPLPGHTFYRMTIDLDVISSALRGHSVIDVQNTSGQALKEVWLGAYPNVFREPSITPIPYGAYYQGFDPGWLKIDEIYVNQKRCLYEDHGPSVRVVLPTPVNTEESMTLDIRWRVKIPKASYRLGGDGQVFLIAHAYPILNILDEKGWHIPGNYPFGDPFYVQCADYLVQLVVPEAYRVASTGEMVGSEAEDTGKQVITVRGENLRDFSWAAILGGKVMKKNSNDMVVSCYFRPGGERQAEKILDLALRSLDYYKSVFGPYPYQELDIVEAPMDGFNGMEFSGMIFLHQDLFTANKSQRKTAFLVAHEVAHQWWYGAVGTDQENEPWLDEGLANWSAHHCLEQMGYPLEVDGKRCDEEELKKGLKDMKSRQQYVEVAYLQGQRYWLEMEKALGKKQLMEVLRNVAEEYRFRIITGREFRNCLEIGKEGRPINDNKEPSPQIN